MKMSFEDKLESGYYSGYGLIYPEVPEQFQKIKETLKGNDSSKIKDGSPAMIRL